MNPHTSIISTTGQPCPASGIWQSMGYFTTTTAISKGTAMPSYCGISTDWFLLVPDPAHHKKSSAYLPSVKRFFKHHKRRNAPLIQS